MLNSNSGFTLVELLLVMVILILMATLGTVRFYTLQNSTYVDKNVSTLIADLKEEQMKAMSGFTEGQTTQSDYGMYLQTDRYTVFRGSTYSASDPSNFTVNLSGMMQINNILFSGSQIIFTKGSGEIAGFVEGSNQFTIRNTASGQQKTITINKYGVITNVQ